MDSTPDGVVVVTRRIGAPAGEIFAVLADPSRHIDLDGSHMLRGAIDPKPVTAVGDVFRMKMFYVEYGDYVMENRVVEYERDRKISWCPTRVDSDDDDWEHRWSFELVPDGPGSTLVSEAYDCSRSPEEAKRIMQRGETWRASMEATLDRLASVVTK